MEFVEGLYILGSNKINDKPYWIQHKAYWMKERGMAIWYEKEDGVENWNIGNIEDLGNSAAIMYSSGNSVGPHEQSIWNAWNYFINHDDDDWSCFQTTDVLVSPAPGIFIFE